MDHDREIRRRQTDIWTWLTVAAASLAAALVLAVTVGVDSTWFDMAADGFPWAVAGALYNYGWLRGARRHGPT